MLVSIIVPCYNHAPYLKDRIESILNQTYQNFELILLDDLSPDNSAEILLSYKNHPKVTHCIINEKNSGSTFAQWNKGVALAKGDLIWIAESDDVADLIFLERLVPQFKLNNNLVIAYCQSYRMDSQNNITGDWLDHTNDLDPEIFKSDFTMSGINYINHFMFNKNTIPNASAVLFKKQIYLNVGRANPNLKWIGDWAIWFKIVSEGDIYFTAKKLNFFRYHSTSVIARAVKNTNHIMLRNEVIKFRQDISLYFHNKAKMDPRLNSLLEKNRKLLYKEITRNSSFAIRKRQYSQIFPTSIQTIKATPLYLIPLVTIKLIIKLIYSVCIYSPLKGIFKK